MHSLESHVDQIIASLNRQLNERDWQTVQQIWDLIGEFRDWTALDSFLIRYLSEPSERSTAIASSFAATLEMVREGQIEMRQDQAFAPLYLRGRQPTKPAKPLEVA